MRFALYYSLAHNVFKVSKSKTGLYIYSDRYRE